MEKPQTIPGEYDEAINRAIAQFEAMNQPRFKGYIKIVVRPAGTRSIQFAEIYCNDRDQHSHEKIFEVFCELLQKAKNHYGVKDFVFDILNRRGDALQEILIGFSRKIHSAMQLVPPPTAQKKAAPNTKKNAEETPATVADSSLKEIKDVVDVQVVIDGPVIVEAPAREASPIVDEQKAVEKPPIIAQPKKRKRKKIVVAIDDNVPVKNDDPAVHSAASIDDQAQQPLLEAIPGLVPCPQPGADVDFHSMKYWPNDPDPAKVCKVFDVCKIKTNGDLLERLGTLEPTREQWDSFVRTLRSTAFDAGVKFRAEAEGSLYQWLTKRKRWVRPYPVEAKPKR